jgi:phosphoglycerate dehydrogenase-like enzyme
MSTAIVVTNGFDGTWPFAADYARDRWAKDGDLTFVRLPAGQECDVSKLGLPADVTRLLLLGCSATADGLASFTKLREVGLATRVVEDSPFVVAMRERDVQVYGRVSEGYWGQSLAEFALGLTICGLRRIPQTHHEIMSSKAPWDYSPAGGIATPGARGAQFGDDLNFANGTIAGKRVRIAGLGNIGSRYAAICNFLGANVAAWDPMAPETVFHRSGTRRVTRLIELARDADIFAPMMPLLDATRGIITADVIDALPKGALMVVTTRMKICDSEAIRRRVLADEIALAADVFDIEPLPLDDPLLGRHNVVHTPHNAGRTVHANHALIDMILDQFQTSDSAPERKLTVRVAQGMRAVRRTVS